MYWLSGGASLQLSTGVPALVAAGVATGLAVGLATGFAPGVAAGVSLDNVPAGQRLQVAAQ